MKSHGLFEKREVGTKWKTLDDAKRGLQGSPEGVERHAQARMKAQELFRKIREGKA